VRDTVLQKFIAVDDKPVPGVHLDQVILSIDLAAVLADVGQRGRHQSGGVALATRGFFGTIAICSANDESKDEYEYLQAGANVSIGKGLAGGLSAILSKLADAHFNKREALLTWNVPLA
jgi:hypothetical protein